MGPEGTHIGLPFDIELFGKRSDFRVFDFRESQLGDQPIAGDVAESGGKGPGRLAQVSLTAPVAGSELVDAFDEKMPADDQAKSYEEETAAHLPARRLIGMKAAL